MNKQTIFEGRSQILLFSAAFECSLLAILKTILELAAWANRNQEFSQSTNRKLRGPQRNAVDVSPIIVIFPICFPLNRLELGNDDISSEEHFEHSTTSRGTVLIWWTSPFQSRKILWQQRNLVVNSITFPARENMTLVQETLFLKRQNWF